MIDIENEVIDLLDQYLQEKFPGINVTGDLVAAPSEFPCVAVEEADNYAAVNTQDSGSNENHAALMYEVKVHSNKGTGRKSEARAIAATVSDFFQSKGFTRKSMNPIKDSGDKVYRLVCRYTATVSADHQIYGR